MMNVETPGNVGPIAILAETDLPGGGLARLPDFGSAPDVSKDHSCRSRAPFSIAELKQSCLQSGLHARRGRSNLARSKT
jgi:hypothetical protein